MSLQIPEYLNVAENERGTSLGIDYESYRSLAKTALAIIQQEAWTMGLYRLSDGCGCGLDVFTETVCLSIQIETVQKEVSLFTCPLDSPFSEAACLLTVSNVEEGWRKLLKLAKEEIS